MNNIEMLDCTLRDGAYIVDGYFGAPIIKGIIKKSQEANIDIIECGWLKDTAHKTGSSFFHVPDDIKQYLPQDHKPKMLVVMIDWDRYNLDNLPLCDHESIDAIRVVFPHGKFHEGIQVGERILQKGYKVFFQAANTLAYNEEELCELAALLNKTDAEAISIVDTFGAMYEEDLERIAQVLDRELKENFKIGFHSHNNQQLSFALTAHFMKLFQGTGRKIVVDASLCGMGRGAGNATTELVANYINKKMDGQYDLNAILDEIDIFMPYFLEKYEWGYSTSYFIAGNLCCHVNNIAYLQKNHRTNSREMHEVIGSLTPQDRLKYDYDLLETKYIEHKKTSDIDDFVALQSRIQGKNVLLIAPGRSVVSHEEQIKSYIEENSPVVIAVDSLYEKYDIDFMFITKLARYEYAKEKNSKKFGEISKILLSNVKDERDEYDYLIDYNRVVKLGWEYFDNPMIACLRLCDLIGASAIAIAGFDEFQSNYNESYFDEFLPTIKGFDKDKINVEIQEMYNDFVKNMVSGANITFVTKSLFNNME